MVYCTVGSPEQSSILVAPGLVVPNRGHDLHDLDPKLGWYLPFGHSSHLSPSRPSLYWPGLHGTTASRPPTKKSTGCRCTDQDYTESTASQPPRSPQGEPRSEATSTDCLHR